MDRRKDILSNKWTNVQMNKQGSGHIEKYINNNKWTDRETERQTDRHLNLKKNGWIYGEVVIRRRTLC